MKKILVVGQTPPPYNGQFIMIQKMLEGNYTQVRLFHIRMSFSKDNDEIGKFRLGKVLHLFKVILKIYYFRFRFGLTTLYYPPSGPNKVSFFRDLLILLSTRFLFKKVIFHFHAGGLSSLYPSLNALLKLLFRWAYFKAELGIRLSDKSPEDCKFILVKNELIIPNGIDDVYLNKDINMPHKQNEVPHLLFVGILCETKGERVLIEACKILHQKGIHFKLQVMGKFESSAYEQEVRKWIAENGLSEKIELLGVKTGVEKNNYFFNADIFCFPSFYENENFPVVLLEAFQFGLPVVTTEWRGIPAIIREGETGWMVPVKEVMQLAEKIEFLIAHPEIAITMGQKARKEYLEKYTLDKFHQLMEEAFLS